MRIKRGLISSLLAVVFALMWVLPSYAANEAVFSATSEKTTYQVGEDITVSFSVDAGPYSATLSSIDMDIGIDNLSVIELQNTNAPFSPGQIYSQVGFQIFDGSKVMVVVYVDPENKPANRSGLIGTMKFKAAKTGSSTISYDRIEAAEEGRETEYVNASASKLTINVVEGGGGAGTVSTGGTTGTTRTTRAGATATVQGATAATGTTTGPEEVILVSLGLGLAIFVVYKIVRFKARRI